MSALVADSVNTTSVLAFAFAICRREYGVKIKQLEPANVPGPQVSRKNVTVTQLDNAPSAGAFCEKTK
jgi:hypothetical protein